MPPQLETSGLDVLNSNSVDGLQAAWDPREPTPAPVALHIPLGPGSIATLWSLNSP